jgi:hypothetical protein
MLPAGAPAAPAAAAAKLDLPWDDPMRPPLLLPPLPGATKPSPAHEQTHRCTKQPFFLSLPYFKSQTGKQCLTKKAWLIKDQAMRQCQCKRQKKEPCTISPVYEPPWLDPAP